jgi:hypothetical protein
MVRYRLIAVLLLMAMLGSIASADITCIRMDDTIKWCTNDETGEEWYEYTW